MILEYFGTYNSISLSGVGLYPPTLQPAREERVRSRFVKETIIVLASYQATGNQTRRST